MMLFVSTAMHARAAVAAEVSPPGVVQRWALGLSGTTPTLYGARVTLYYLVSPRFAAKLDGGHSLNLMGTLDFDEGLKSDYHWQVSPGVVFFPRRAFRGPALQLDAISRTSAVDGSLNRYRVTAHAGRALAGWYWQVKQRGFVSLVSGLSYGRAVGRTWANLYDAGRPVVFTKERSWLLNAEFVFRWGLRF